VVVRGATDIVVVIGHRRFDFGCTGLLIQAVLEDRLNTFVPQCAQQQCPLAGRLQPVWGVGFLHKQYAEARTVGLFRVEAGLQEAGYNFSGTTGLLTRPANEAFR
tara:strand:- start:810 stop:1124 length:315 start_codon:yes stop_codon:yes gene_type:complete